MPFVILKSNASTTADVLIKDMGILVPLGGGSVTLTGIEAVTEVQQSSDAGALATDNAYGTDSSTIILNDGTSDIPQADMTTFCAAAGVKLSNAGAGKPLWKQKTDASLEFKTITAGTGITLSGSSSDEIQVKIDGRNAPIDWEPDATAPTETIVQNVRVLGMPDAISTSVIAFLALPPDIDLNVSPRVNFSYVTVATATGAGKIRWRVIVGYIAEGETLGAPGSSETVRITDTVVNTLDTLNNLSFVLNPSLMSPGDFLRLKLERQGTSWVDTFTEEVGVVKKGQFLYN